MREIPSNVDGLLQEVERLSAGEQPEQLQAVLQALTAVSGRSAHSLNLYALFCISQQRFDDAAEALREALEKAPDDPEVHFSIAELLTGSDELDCALFHYKQSLLHGKEREPVERATSRLTTERALRGERRLLFALDEGEPETLAPAVQKIRSVDPHLNVSVLTSTDTADLFEASGIFEEVLTEPDDRFYEYIFFGASSAKTQEAHGALLESQGLVCGTVPDGEQLDPTTKHLLAAEFIAAEAGKTA